MDPPLASPGPLATRMTPYPPPIVTHFISA